MDESTPCSLEKKYYKDAMDWYYYLCVMLSRVQFFVTPQTAAHQAPLSMEFSRQEYWSGLPFHTPGKLSNPGIEPMSLVSTAFPALAGRFFTTVPLGKTHHYYYLSKVHYLNMEGTQQISSPLSIPPCWFFIKRTHTTLEHQYISNVCTNSLLTQAKYIQLTTENVTLN